MAGVFLCLMAFYVVAVWFVMWGAFGFRYEAITGQQAVHSHLKRNCKLWTTLGLTRRGTGLNFKRTGKPFVQIIPYGPRSLQGKFSKPNTIATTSAAIGFKLFVRVDFPLAKG
jgi:hypothetical protein